MANVANELCRVCKIRIPHRDIELGQIFCSVRCQVKRDPIDDSLSLLRREAEEEWLEDQMRDDYNA